MITSSEGFIVGTPTKTGASTVEDVARRFVRNNGVDGDMFRVCDWGFPRRKHGMCLPPTVREAAGGIVIDGHAAEYDEELAVREWGGHDRWLLLRNPFARYVSIYKYLSLGRNYSQWGAKQLQAEEWAGPRAEFSKADRRGETWHLRPRMTFSEFMVWYSDERERMSTPKMMRRRGDLNEGRAYRSPWVWLDSLVDSARFMADAPTADDQGGVVEGYLTVERLFADEATPGSLRRLFACYGMDPNDVGKRLHANKTRGWGSERYGVYRDVTFEDEFWGAFGLSEDGVKLAEFQHQCAGMVCGVCRSGVVGEYCWWLDALHF